MGLVRDFLGYNPLSGHLFVFRNRPGDRVKVLYWDRSGLCIWYKRLEKGVFKFPAAAVGELSVEITWADLMLILEGIDLSESQREIRYRLAA
jgi:transposase